MAEPNAEPAKIMSNLADEANSDNEVLSSDDVMEELGGDNIQAAIASESAIPMPMQSPGWTELMPAWPSRLLHVETMTSVPRGKGNIYAGHVEPRYNILSYTWGRFTNPASRSVDVKGVEWSIPAIDESHFSVEEFEDVIRKVGRGVNFIWLDVACIHQEDDEEKAEEVGRQAGIFKNAYRAYIWLTLLEDSALTTCVERVCCDGMFNLMKLGDVRSMVEDPAGWTKDIKDGMESTRAALKGLFTDPWFSSLWTLQESILRRDSFILSRKGAEIFTSLSNRPWQLKGVASSCYEYLESLLPFSNIPTPRERNYITRLPHGPALELLSGEADSATSLCELIRRSGLGFVWTSNPNLAYCVGQYRATKEPLDRIFGIMQIYGINCAQSSGSTEVSVRVQELEDRFGSELVKMSPLLSQMFLHATFSRPRRSWLITQQCTVPAALDIRGSGFESSGTSLCQMSVGHEGHIEFCGKAWGFKGLLRWVTIGHSVDDTVFQQAISRVLQRHGSQATGSINKEERRLDQLTLEDAGILSSMRPPRFGQDRKEIRLRPSSGAPQVSILLDRHHELPLGSLERDMDLIVPGTSRRDEELYTLLVGIQVARTHGEDNLRVLLLGQIPHAGLMISIGLILLLVHARQADSKAHRWERIGLVVWHAPWSQQAPTQGDPIPPLRLSYELNGQIQ